MATSKQKNGIWEDWQVSRIKGENGEDGSSISIKGTAYEHHSTTDDWTPNNDYPCVLIDKITETSSDGTTTEKYCIVKRYGRPRPGAVPGWMTIEASEGDCYIMETENYDNGHLYVVNAESWTDVGQIKGDTGETGQDGKNAYVHIKYAKSLTANDWSENNGETPSAYIGIYTDNNPTDQLVWSLYTWKKWQGEDGFGYEYIYKRTTTATAPDTPTETSQEDGFVPTDWTDDPTGVDSTNLYEWVCYRKKTYGSWGAFIGSSADSTKAALWAKYGEKGATGATGATGNYTEVRFAKNGSSTTPPSLNQFVKAPDGWVLIQPSVGTLEYLWATTAIKNGAGLLITPWSTPVRMNGVNGKDGEDGKDGKSPVMLYRGEYVASKTYYGNQYRCDCVSLNGAYYIARIDAGEFNSIAPPDTNKWNAFGSSFESVATNLLLANLANIAGFIFRNSRLESQTLADGTVTDGENSKTPMVYMNGKTGQVAFAGGKVLFNSDGTVDIGNGKFTVDANGNVVLNDLTMNNITANNGTFKGLLNATQGIVYNVRTINANNQTLTNADAFVCVTYERKYTSDWCVINMPYTPNNGQIITIKNINRMDTVYLYGNGHKICPGQEGMYEGNIDPTDGGYYMYVQYGRTHQYIFDGNMWQQVGQFDW